MIVTLASLVGISVLLTAVGGHPVDWAKDRWYDLIGATKPIADVTAEADPADSADPRYPVENVVDGSAAGAWATEWHADTVAPTDCRGAEGVGKIRLILKEATRVRGLDVWTGVTGGERLSQFRPRRLDVSFGTDGCVHRELKDTAESQPVDFDTGDKVKSITIGVGSTFLQKVDPKDDLVAIGRIDLLKRPD